MYYEDLVKRSTKQGDELSAIITALLKKEGYEDNLVEW